MVLFAVLLGIVGYMAWLASSDDDDAVPEPRP